MRDSLVFLGRRVEQGHGSGGGPGRHPQAVLHERLPPIRIQFDEQNPLPLHPCHVVLVADFANHGRPPLRRLIEAVHTAANAPLPARTVALARLESVALAAERIHRVRVPARVDERQIRYPGFFRVTLGPARAGQVAELTQRGRQGELDRLVVAVHLERAVVDDL